MRPSLLSQSFLAAPIRLGDRQLRPLTAGSLLVLQEAGNLLFRPAGPDPTDTEAIQALFEFAWVHLAPLDQVAAATPEDIRRGARALALETDLSAIATLSNDFSALNQRLAAAGFKPAPTAEKKPAAAVPPPPSPIGSPASSTASEPAPTPPPSITSSGSSPSTAPSNTTTPPTPPTASPSAGPFPSRIWQDSPPAAPSPPEPEETLIPIPAPSSTV